MADRGHAPGPPGGSSTDPGRTGSQHPTDVLASYLLDALEEDERAAVEAHLSGCARCQAELVHLQTAVDALPFAAPLVAPPPSARGKLFERVAADQEYRRTWRTARGAPEVAEQDRPHRDWTVWGGWTAAAAGVAAAAFGAWNAAGAQREAAALRGEVAALHADVEEQARVLDQIDPAGARLAALRGAGSAIEGRVVYQPDGQTAWAVLERLPALQPGRVYQLWLLPSAQGAPPVSAGTFEPGPSGTASVVIRAPSRLAGFAGIGLTAEPAPGRTAPSGPILANGSIG